MRAFSLRELMNTAAKWAGCLALLAASTLSQAQETVCARVKIEIKQELTLERQAFDAEMKINNTLESASLSEVGVQVKITDELGAPVRASSDPNDTSASFFIRVSNRQNIGDVDGTGVVAPSSTATINWLIIPAPGSAGVNPSGKKFLVGATLQYRFGSETHTVEVSPDVITVKPLPLLTLDYFLTRDVVADDPMTPAIEPIEPFTLGVRVSNNGAAAARALKIDSAQPKIIENNQGLLINFKLTGSYLDDAPVQNSLLIDFGDIAPARSRMGRWIMETTLAGTFTEFDARFSHSDELGGALTSLLEATNTHLLIRDVRVDLPGRDAIQDFLARDGEVIRVYESDGADTEVLDRSSQAVLSTTSSGAYHLSMPPTTGFFFARISDPYNGQRALTRMVRSDAKAMLPENVWLSKTKNLQTQQWEYWLNVFDVNSTGTYSTEFGTPSTHPRPPVIQFIPDRTVTEGQQVSFLVEASSPDARPVTLSASPLPSGATFVQQPPNPATPGLTVAVFDWTPSVGQAGNYLLVYRAVDGLLNATRSAAIRVESSEPPPGPAVPTIEAPGLDVHVPSALPTLVVRTSSNALDPTTTVEFEVYSDEAMTQLVDSASVPRGTTTGAEATTSYTLVNELNDNTRHWWRARAYDGTQRYSAWVNGRFFVNLFNDAPDSFNLTTPAPGASVATILPELVWTNSADRDGDAISYTVQVYGDAALTQLVASATGLAPVDGGSTSWTVNSPLENHGTYYWRVIAIDSHDAQTAAIARTFVVDTGNAPPTDPVISSPAIGSQVNATTVQLTALNGTDADNDLLTYVFELDTVETFDSGDKRTSGQIIQGSGSNTSWIVDELTENQRYWWRVRAQDGRADSQWVVGNFLVDVGNDVPPAPTIRNPSDGAWSTTRLPTLEANPVLDPEGGSVRYEFEIYVGAQSGTLVVSGVSPTPSWTVPVELADDTTHRWRVRALDQANAPSEWSAYAVLYISTGPYEDPSIQVTSPSTIGPPDTDGTNRTVTIAWQGTNNNIDATVALYYSTQRSEFVGELIVDGLRQPAGMHTGTYLWNVSQLAPGAYHVYAVIYDSRGIGRAFAPGSVVIPNPTQGGAITITSNPPLITTEAGGTASFGVRLANAPSESVTVPVRSTRPSEGTLTPSTLTFTPQNWSADQTVTITGVRDCAPDTTQDYSILVGPAVSLDPNYVAVQAPAVPVTNVGPNVSNTTNVPTLHICRIEVVTRARVGLLMWEYTLSAELTNTGSPLTGVTAQLINMPSQVQVLDGQLQFGAVGTMETLKSTDTVKLRAPLPFEQLVPLLGLGFRWNVTVTD
jgi:hypothetical protein